MLNVNGSRRFIWNVSGRHDTCGHTSTPSASGLHVGGHDLLVPRVAEDREQRGPRERSTGGALHVEHVGVRDLLAGKQRDDALVRVVERLHERDHLFEIGDA